MIIAAKKERCLKGVKVTKYINLTHLFFVDDIFILGDGTEAEWNTFIATSLFIARPRVWKSVNTSLHFTLITSLIRLSASLILPSHTRCCPMDQGFHYLGFFLKPNYHRIEDWRWLLKITEGKVHNWCYPWLSIGGRLTLIKSTLESIRVLAFPWKDFKVNLS